MMEFRMTTDMQTALPREIGFNFEELKAGLSERLEHYNGLVVTEDTIKEGKADRANLNRLRTAIDDHRKAIKKSYMQPYNEFEAKCKELTVLIDKPIAAIDTQLKAFEEKRREEKTEQIRDLYAGNISDSIKEIIPLNRIFDQKWLNAGTTMKKIEEDLTAWEERVNADMLALDSVEEEYRTAVRQKYAESLSVTAAIAHRDALKAAELAFRQKEEERLARQAQKAAEATVEPQKPTSAPAPTPEAAPAQAPEEKLNILRLEFEITRAQAFALKDFLDARGIMYHKI